MPTFTNRATLSYNGTSTVSNIVTGEYTQALQVLKTAVSDSYQSGGTVAYVVSFINNGATPVTALSLSDDLGRYTPSGLSTPVYPLNYTAGTVRFYVNGVLQATPTISSIQPLTLTGLTIPAGGNATLVYSTTANEYAPLEDGASIDNTVTVTGAGVSTPITAQATVSPQNAPALNITKSVSPSDVSEGDTITYTFVISNTGNAPADAADNVAITDTFSPLLSNITVTCNGTVMSAGSFYTYDDSTGLFSTVPGQITVPAATYNVSPTTGAYSVVPGETTVTVSGTV